MLFEMRDYEFGYQCIPSSVGVAVGLKKEHFSFGGAAPKILQQV
jgi:hypothetical protein